MKVTLRMFLLLVPLLTVGQAAVLIAPIAGQFPDTFVPCAGCTQLAYLSENETNITGNLAFTFNAAVYTDPGNTFCAGCFDFFYQVINKPASTDDIGRISVINFTSWEVDAGYSVGGEPADGGTAFPTGTIVPGLVDRNTADTVGFQFASTPDSSAIAPGQTSTVLVVETNAIRFTSGFASVIDGGATNVASFEPTAVPEPATEWLLGLGLIGLARVRFFRGWRNDGGKFSA